MTLAAHTSQSAESGWERFRATKTYDLIAASPLVLWLGLGLSAQFPLLMTRLAQLSSGVISITDSLQFSAILGSAAFNLAAIHLLIVRTKPVRKSRGVLPRITALLGAFFGSSLYMLPAVHRTLPIQAISNVMIFAGSCGALLVLLRLGRAFAVLPEVRMLNTSGPYAFVRHPLYLCETIAYAGLMLQFQEPWALIIMLATFSFMYARSAFEERVLEEEFPHYAEYRARTSRFIPGVF